MAKSRITFEVDHTQLFDGVSKVGTAGVGERLIGAFLIPAHVSTAEAIGLAVYGITVVNSEPVAEDEPAASARNA
jgi:hypothetical protein